MALPIQLTNLGNPIIDALQLMSNFNWLDSGKIREGVTAAVLADGTGSVTVTFAPAFSTAIVSAPMPGVSDYSGTDNAVITPRITAYSPTSITWTVGGGQSGSTVKLHYRISGY